MKAASSKRVLAYLLDIILLSFFISLISYFLPASNAYKKASEELNNVMSDYTEKKIDDDTYIKKANELSYTLNKESVAVTIITIVVYIIYFVVVPYYYNGQTLGKKIMKIKIVSNVNQDKKLSMNNYLIRALIIDTILLNIIEVVAVLVLSKSAYITTNNFVSNFFSVLYVMIFVMILFNKDGRGLHDMIAGTKVVAVDSEGNVIPEAEVINEVKEEQPQIETKTEPKEETKEKEEKTSKSKKTTTKSSDSKSKTKNKKNEN